MYYRKIGKSSLSVSEIGLGTMSIGTDLKKGIKIIEKALDKGINFIDTADLYDFGLNEEIVGQAIKGKRNNLIIATKGGNDWSNPNDTWCWNPSKKYIKTAVKNSLSRLQTDYIDLYQLHGGMIEDNIDETIEAFDELVSEGTIRYYGLSSIRPNVITQYVEKSHIVSVMMPYNILDRRAEELFPLFKNNQISVLARGTLAKGLLTKNYHTKVKKDYLSYSLEELQVLLPSLSTLQCNTLFNALAIHFILQDETVASAIVGASRDEQIESTYEGYTQSVNDETIEHIRLMTKKDLFTQHR